MKRFTTLLAAALLALTAVTAPATAAPVPVPEDDPFYAVPADIADYTNGAVIASRQISASALSLPLQASAWQVKYRTTDSKGRPSATVTTLLVPLLPWLGKGPRPLVSYQAAEDGVAGKCAPSYALRAGLAGGFSNSSLEATIMATALLQGWALTIPDYEGPRSEFLVARTEARGVLDGIRAAKAFGPAGIAGTAPTALWGYSGGSFASSVAAQYQPTYAPDVELAGVALGGYVADVRATIDAFSGSALGGAIPMGINGFHRAYPELNLMSYLNESGRQKVADAAGDCINDAAPRSPFLSIGQIEATPGALDLPVPAGMLLENSPTGIAGVPSAPVYHYHAILDEFAPIGPAREMMRRWCAAGVPVQNVEHLLAEHLSETATGAPGALAFLKARFSGSAPVDSCGSIPGR